MSSIADKFSIPLSKIFMQVQSEAKQRNNWQIHPEHLLLAILKEPASAARQMLVRLGVDLDTLYQDLCDTLQSRDKGEPGEMITMSEETKHVLELGLESKDVLNRPYLGTEHLLIAMMRDFSGHVYPILRRIGVTYNRLLETIKAIPMEPVSDERRVTQMREEMAAASAELLSFGQILGHISPVFWLLLTLTVLSGMAVYNSWFREDLAVFAFVTLGWIVSVSLHEFGHAIVAYFGGDKAVLQRGYLTLNPLRYTHGFMSIILPVIVLMLGGIGLPGGAVYINLGAVRSKKLRSLVSAAGPMMTALVTIVLSLPFLLGLAPAGFAEHSEFWAGMTFLVFIQIWALVFNLMPVPGFDGFGILLPFLPRRLVAVISRAGSLIFFFFISMFLMDTAIQRMFWQLVGGIVSLLGLNTDMMRYGLDLYHFW